MVGVQSAAEPIPGYQLLDRLGQGGFGEVWKARAPGGILKAIKIVHGCLHGDADDELYVRQELKALERVRGVRHPFILSLERYDIIDGQLFIVMELADCSLWDRYQQCRQQGMVGIPRDEMLRYMDETAEALDLMNREYQLQHLDIKPQNLFLLYNHIKVGDFGLVKGLEGMQANKVTSGVTPVYAAPETFEGVVSHFCDQYNLAIVYQELVTGRLPFAGKTAQQLMMQHLTAAPNLEPLPGGERAAVARALAKKPEERHATCGDFVRALRQANGSAEAWVRPASVPCVNETAFLGAPNSAAARKDVEAPAQATTPSRTSPDAHSDRERATLLYGAANGAGEQAPKLRTSTASPPERPEETGDGVLFPALVIGLGSVGLAVLQQLRANLHKRVGPSECLPNIRFLEI
ncbi:MAG TPA: serine/threonine-protein kinase, partial [Gemmataceae bacterium]|nr:serine/threonine-protein kinase [Gemmataceae bacterium]